MGRSCGWRTIEANYYAVVIRDVKVLFTKERVRKIGKRIKNWFWNEECIRRSLFRTGFLVILVLFLGWFAGYLPKPLFNDPYSTILNDKDNDLLAARIAEDEQWRFPPADSVPDKFRQAIILFEDEYFRYHPGINPVSMVKAIIQNLRAGEIVRGGSTISLQVVRMSRKGKPRTIQEKLLECIMALRLELKYSKEDILTMYCAHAPFGGNVVGLEAAAWRYFGRSPFRLSWSETASLAVLPNSPALIFPGTNQDQFLSKRNRLLDKLYKKGKIDNLSCELAKEEPLPGSPKPLPQITPHLLDRAILEGLRGQRVHSSIDKKLQINADRIVNRHSRVLQANEIHNAAALIIDVESGNVLAYVGNTAGDSSDHCNQVDIINAPRSSGSILKPFLYALMLKDGHILPATLIPDIPTQIAGYTPKNFDKEYDGAVHADNALARSLNIPAVRMLREYGIETFHRKLNELNFTTIDKPPDHYGLSLILGGAEITLWEVTGAYASMARKLRHYRPLMSKYDRDDQRQACYRITNTSHKSSKLKDQDIFGAGAIWYTFEAIAEMNRPIEGAEWSRFYSSHRIAWKTGTSFGHRDAWAVGITPEYVVGVWVGNADGEGRPGLTGVSAAAPVMFDIYKLLPETGWFTIPWDDLVPVNVCRNSGFKASEYCTDTDTLYVPEAGTYTRVCPYHMLVHLDKEEKYQVSSDCYRVDEMINRSWFVLPPVMEYYYKYRDPFYKSLPPMHPACLKNEGRNMDLIYPKPGARLFIPKGLDELKERLVFEAVHRMDNMTLYWYIDREYLGTTTSIHQLEINAEPGIHTLTLISEDGEQLIRNFEIISR